MEKINDEARYIDFDAQVDKFLKGQMNDEEESDFKSLILSDADLRQRAGIISSLLKGLNAEGKNREERIVASVARAGKANKFNKKVFVESIIACAALVTIIFSAILPYYNKLRVNNMLEPYYTDFDTSLSLRGELDSVTFTNLSSCFKKVKEGKDLEKTTNELARLYNSPDNETYRYFANDIAWYYAIALIKKGENEEAITVLDKLIGDNNGMPIAKRAKKLIEEIKKLL